MKKSKRNKLLRAAVGLSLLGAMVVPAEIEAIAPDTSVPSGQSKPYYHYYGNQFDWRWPGNFNTEYTVPYSEDQQSSGSVFYFDNDFYAVNIDSPGEKLLTHMTNFKNLNYTLESNRIGLDGWYVYTNPARIMREEISQNGVALRNTREHEIRFEILGRKGWTSTWEVLICDVYYKVHEAMSSDLYFVKDEGITWKDKGTLLAMDSKFDLGKNSLDFSFDNMQINNLEDVQPGQYMEILNDGGFYDFDTFFGKMNRFRNETTSVAFENMNLKNSITATGKVNLATSFAMAGNSHSLALNAKSYTLGTLGLNLSNIGDGEGKDAWVSEGTLYHCDSIEPSSPLAITITGAIAGTNVKAGDTMNLLELSGPKAGSISTYYGTDTTTSFTGNSKNINADFSDASTGGVVVTGTRTDTLSSTYNGNSGSNYNYKLTYEIGDKNITGVALPADGFDLSNTKGGFVAKEDDGYKLDTGITLNFDSMKFSCGATSIKAGIYTLLDLTNASGNGTLSFSGTSVAEGGKSAALLISGKVSASSNGVTAFQGQDITFNVTGDTNKKIEYTADDTKYYKIQLGTFDVNRSAAIFNNLRSKGTIDATNFKLTGFTDLQTIANSYGDTEDNPLTLMTAYDNAADLSKWTWEGDASAEREYEAYNKDGITATMAGTLGISDDNKNIEFKTNGLKTLSYGSIDWNTSKAAVSLDGGKLGSVDLSSLAMSNKPTTGTMTLLDAEGMTGEGTVTSISGWTENTSGNTTTYRSSYTGETESVKGAGMTLSVNRADQISATKTETNGKYDLSVDYTANKGFVTGFSFDDGIIWKKDGDGKSYGFKLTEDYDFSTLTNAITFDASNPYTLIANPDQVGEGDTMTFFEAGDYMTEDEWRTKVNISNATGESKPYEEKHGAVTATGQVQLQITKDNENKKVIGKISNEYLSGVTINLSNIGKEDGAEESKWENKKLLYSQTASTQNYDHQSQKTTVTVSGDIFGGTTDGTVQTDQEIQLLHIAGNNAGKDGSITTTISGFEKKDDNTFTKAVNFSDTATNGIIATGSHVDTITRKVSETEGQGTYDLTYKVGQKTVTGLSATSLDVDQTFVAGSQYTLGEGSDDFVINVDNLVIGATGNSTDTKTIIDFRDDSSKRNFKLSTTGNSEAKDKVTSSIEYAETEKDAVNGVTAAGNQERTFSTDGERVYLNSVTEDVNKVIIGKVDLSDNATRRSFDNLAQTGTIDANTATYTANKAIADVAGKTLTVVGVKEGSENTFKNWGEQPAATTIAVNQATGISAVVNATYDMSDGNINLKTDGLKSITFGAGIAWNKDTTAVSLTGQNVGTVDFSSVSFSDNGVVKNETMHLLSAKDMDMTQAVSTVTAPSQGWTKRDGEAGTTYYDKDKDNRTHDAADNLTDHGITLSVDRGDRITETTTTDEDGKKSYTLDYTRGQGYVTGMTIATDGITWKKDETAITLAEDYDFSSLADNGIAFNGSTLKFSNLDKISYGDTMTFFDATDRMSVSDWTSKVSVTNFPQSETAYTETHQAVTVSGKVNMEVTKTEVTDTQKEMKVNAKVTEAYLGDITVDLSKIGNQDTDTTSKWDTTNPLYKNTINGQDYGDATRKTSVTISGSLFGGTTDETVKAGETMTLVYIEGKNAGVDGNLTKYDNVKKTVDFSDTTANGLVATGTHEDTLESTAKSANDQADPTKGSYTLEYTVGTKTINAITATTIDLTEDTFTAGTKVGSETEAPAYVLSDNIALDLTNAQVYYTESSITDKEIINFSGDANGSFTLTGANNDGTLTKTVAYSETKETNGIRAEGTQNNTFSLSEDKKTVSVSSNQTVSHVIVGKVDHGEEIRTFDNLTKEGTVSAIGTVMNEDGTVSTKGSVILDNLSLTKDLDKSFTVAKATGTYGFDGWTLPQETEDVYCIQETGVEGIMEGQFKSDTGTEADGSEYSALKIEMKGIKAINFYDGVKWREGSAVLDFTGANVDFTGKSINATRLSFDKDSVNSLITTDGVYRMVLINTEENQNLAKADITNNENIEMNIADTITFKGETKLSADKLQFVADMWRGTGTVSDAAHRHVMAQTASSQAVVNGNVDATDSISRALSHYRADDKDENSMIFASIGGSKTRTETGSHISQHLWNVNAGVGTRKDLASGAHTEYGLYYEGGTGTYHTKGAGDGITSTKGDLKHHGAGFLFRYENKNHIYGEAGAHVGRVKNKNQALGLDDSATYYGFHLGIGKIIETNDKDSWDLYTKFYWNRTNGMSYHNSAVTEINLDSVTSKLLRIGGRYNHQTVNDWSFYAGAAFAYEFGGNSNGTAGIVNGDFGSLRTATTKGAGALLEIGLRKEAANGSPWDIDLGLKGYLGRQKGIGGNIGVNYHF